MSNVFDRARVMVSALCDGKRDWMMSIPADPVRDPDLVIAEAIGAGEALYAVVERLVRWWEADDANVLDDLLSLEDICLPAQDALAKARGEVKP